MPLPQLETDTGPGWRVVYTATLSYCQVGQHFIGANEQAYRFWLTPLTSIATVCMKCAQEGES